MSRIIFIALNVLSLEQGKISVNHRGIPALNPYPIFYCVRVGTYWLNRLVGFARHADAGFRGSQAHVWVCAGASGTCALVRAVQAAGYQVCEDGNEGMDSKTIEPMPSLVGESLAEALSGEP